MLLIGGLVNQLGLREIVWRLGRLVFGFVGGLVPRVMTWGSLGIGHNGMDGMFALPAPLIHQTEHEGRSEAGPGLCVNRLLDQFVPAIKFSTTLYHLGFH